MRSCQAPFFENLLGDSTPQEKGDAHYVSRSFFKKMFNVLLRSHLTLHLDRLSLMKNNYTFDDLRRVCKQKTEMYTTWPIGWFNFLVHDLSVEIWLDFASVFHTLSVQSKTKWQKSEKKKNSYILTYSIFLEHVTPSALPRRIFILLNQY